MRKLLKRLLAFQHWSLFTKGFVAILLVGWGTLLFMTLVGVLSLRGRLGGQLQEEFSALSTQQMSKIVDLIGQQVALTRVVALNTAVVEEVVAATTRYSGDPVAELATLNQTWQNAAMGDQMVRMVTDPAENILTAQLLDYVDRAPEFASILIADQYGGLLAATYRPTDYDCTTQFWWQAVFEKGQGRLYLTAQEGDAGRELLVAMPIYDESGGKVVGVVRAAFGFEGINELLEELRKPSPASRVGVALFDSDQNVLAASSSANGADINPAWLESDAYRRKLASQELAFADGQPALVAYSFIEKLTAASTDVVDEAMYQLSWSLLVYAPLSDVFFPLTRALWNICFVALGWGAVLTLAGYALMRFLSGPLSQLVGVVAQEAAGDRNVRAWVYAPDDVGKLAQNVNRLIEEKLALQHGVEQRSVERDLEQKRRQLELETTAAIGAVTSVTLELNDLIAQAVELIHDRFGLYFVGVFLLNATRTWAVLYGGTGEAGHALLNRGYRARVDIGCIGQCITEGKASLNRDVENSIATELPELPYTRSELALPLRSRGEVLGALSVHSYHKDTFDGDLAVVLQIIADQIAVAIDSIRLFDARQEATRSLQRAYGEASREAWESLLHTRDSVGAGYQAKLAGSAKLPPAPPENWRPDAYHAWQEERMVQSEDNASHESYLALPIVVRGVVIGVIDVSKPLAAGAWTQAEVAELETLTYQIGVALENARLYEDARSRAVRQRLLSDVSSRIRSPLTVDAVLQAAVREMREVLGLDEAEVRLGKQFETPADVANSPDAAAHHHK
ncbi:MAG: GAF domain-containing protein [Anaerolineae bacterium]|nr:GAF domain-containing protein [Anaerolineae bacterium]